MLIIFQEDGFNKFYRLFSISINLILFQIFQNNIQIKNIKIMFTGLS